MPAVEYVKEGRIAVMTINRPEAMNSLNVDVTMGLREAMIDFRDDDEVWVAIITGAGNRAFSAGADIKGFRPGTGQEATRDEAPVRADTIWKPFIAAINGYCLGGGLELALMCDIRIASDNASFGQPEVNIGFMPGMGATQRLPRFISRVVASEMILAGERMNAQEAYRIGLVNRVVPFDDLMPTARKMAETICQRGQTGVRASKEAIIKGYDLTLEEGLQFEREKVNYVRTTEDFMEGARAFAEKRPPNYKGK